MSSSQSLQRTAKGRARNRVWAISLAALEAQTVSALFEAHQRLVDLGRRFGLHLHEHEFQIVLNVDIGVAKVENRAALS